MRATADATNGLLQRAADGLVAAERNRLPDLAHAVVLVPDPHAAGDVARALRAASGCATLLLPRITTLRRWAEEVPLESPIEPRAARESALYQALIERDWLGSADRWGVSAELAALFEELTRQSAALPADLEEFTAQLARAYRARRGQSLSFEARLVHELWHALARAGGGLDAEAAYQLRLARLARAAAAPLYAIGLARLAPAEARFFEEYAERAPVRTYLPDAATGAHGVARVLAAAWPADADHPPLRERACGLREAQPASPLAGRMRVFGAASAEQEAQAVDVAVREWLLAGKRAIAVVVQDRLVARRARALLERAQVLVKDEAGWRFSTTSAATAIGRWLDVASNDCYHRDLLDLLKSPFVFSDWTREARRRAVWRLEGYVRDAGVVAGLGNFIRLAQARGDAEVRQLLLRVQGALRALGRRRRPIALWLQALEASLAGIGAREGLAADSAGEQLLELLAGLAEELRGDRLGLGLAEWRRWLARHFEAVTYRDRAIESPVVFTSLSATQLRAFDAVLILGCDAAHLPGADPVAMFFNQHVRAELGLPTWADAVREIEAQLAALIGSGAPVLATWQRMHGGESNLLSPQLERLVALHQLAYGSGIEDAQLAARLPGAQVSAPPALPPAAAAVPRPAAPPDLVPAAISASGYNSLMACPYQFFARYLLRLAELDEVQELIEKKDYGEKVHAVLARFHREHPRVSALEPAQARQALEALSEHEFAAAVKRNYLAQAWLARWKALVPGYLEWQRGREARGWTWRDGELERALEVASPGGARLRLRGRIDRVDSGAAGAAVIDYKTRAARALREALARPGEDVQLPVYAALAGEPVAEALYLSIEREGIEPVALEGEPGALADEMLRRLGELYDALRAGAALPAQGVESACRYCEARGLCRRNHWP